MAYLNIHSHSSITNDFLNEEKRGRNFVDLIELYKFNEMNVKCYVRCWMGGTDINILFFRSSVCVCVNGFSQQFPNSHLRY